MNPAFVGRQRELAALGQHLAAALAGQPRFCFVTGEAGAGDLASDLKALIDDITRLVITRDTLRRVI